MGELVFQAMERLARSSWGQQGVGKCGNWRTWRAIVHAGWARPLPGEDVDILSLTVRGWRALEAERCERKGK